MQAESYPTALPFLPVIENLPALRNALAGCEGCPLYGFATRAVFGVGPRRATAMLVGEQPGNDEDLQGIPFVGPAGKLLDQTLDELRIDRAQMYVTNAVKHFKFV